MSTLRAAVRLVLFLLVLGVFAAILNALRLGRPRAAVLRRQARWLRRWAACSCRAAGLRVTVHGPLPPPGSLITPNHMGYLDIFALGACVPGFFVPKAEVAGWPLLGRLIRACGHVFVDRTRKRALLGVGAEIAARLRAGACVFVFLEGTSTAGGPPLPFRPGLLQPALDCAAPIVPAALTWHVDAARNGRPVDVGEEVAYWRDEHTFGPHLWHVLGLRGVACTVRFGPPLAATAAPRQQLAGELHEAVITLRGVRGA